MAVTVLLTVMSHTVFRAVTTVTEVTTCITVATVRGRSSMTSARWGEGWG